MIKNVHFDVDIYTDAELFVSGEEGSFINGASLVVDGGMSCN